MKKLFAFLVFAIGIIPIFADGISEEEAIKLAQQFLGSNSSGIKMRMMSTPRLTLSYVDRSVMYEDEVNFYVFNRAWNQGYVIVSGDNRSEDMILGYSDEGNFDYNDIPENLRWWLSQYSGEVDYIRANSEESESVNMYKIDAVGDVVIPPLLGNNKWHQGVPFNNMCPEKNGVKCPVGCVALSMAQIMYYFRWPLVGTSSKRYMWNNQALSVDFTRSHYDWDKFKQQYSLRETGESVDALAKLCYDCGVAVEMVYDLYASGATFSNTVSAFTKYFNYSDLITAVSLSDDLSRQRYTNWENKIKSELNKLSPVFYAGSGSSGAHAFVCDGYTSNGYFHFNWGWSGNYNGYFKIQALNPNTYDFNESNYIITCLSKPYNKNIYINGLYYNQLNSSSMEVTYVPDNGTKYSGKITIPSVITYNGVKYDVNSVNDFAFFGCTGVTDIYVNWDTPPIIISYAFDDVDYENVVLHVPIGSVELYSVADTWSRFVHIVDASSASSSWSSWSNFYTGTGVYTSTAYNLCESEGAINYRQSLADASKWQIRIDDMFNNVSMFMNYNPNTNKCQMPIFFTGDYGSKSDSIYRSDVPTFATYAGLDADKYSYDNYPCYYDPETGLFTLNVVAFKNAKEYVIVNEEYQLDGYPDYTISIKSDGKTEYADGSCSMLFNVVKGDDVASYTYLLVDSIITDSVAKTIARKIGNGDIESQSVGKDQFFVKIPTDGSYSVIAVSFAANGKYRKYDYATFNYYSYINWKYIGTCHFTDDVVLPFYYEDPVTYDVEVEMNANIWGFYRLKNPYGSVCPTKTGTYSKDDIYIEVHAESPNMVYIENQQIGRDMGGGFLCIESQGAYYMRSGCTKDEVKSMGCMGTYKDSAIIFPINGLLLGLVGGEYLYNANTNGKFRIDFTDTPLAVESVIADKKNSNNAIYDVAGRRVFRGLTGLRSGVYIVDGKKYFVK